MIDDSPRRGRSTLFAERIVRYRIGLLVIGLVMFAFALPVSRRLEFNRSIESMFPPSDETFRGYRLLQKEFGGNAVVILVYQDRELSTAQGLARNQELTDRVSKVPGVAGVLSPALLNDAVKKFQPAGLLSATGLVADDPPLFREGDRVSEGFDELFSGYTHSPDHSRAAVVAMLDPNHPTETIDRLKQIGQELPHPNGPASIVGEPVLVHDGFELIERDGARLATLTVALLSVVVIISLADARFVALTAIMIIWSSTITRGTMVLLGINLSIVSTILTAIVTVISVTAVLHLGVRFRIARTRGYAQQAAVERTIAWLIVPIVWTCATDAAGFAALYGSRILPIRQFGLMIAIAAMAVCVAIVLFAPALMMVPGIRAGERFQRMQGRQSRALRRRCLRLSNWAIGHPMWCLAGTFIVLGLIIAGIGRAETETSFLNNFRPNSPVVKAYDDVESQFGGAGVWDIVLDAPSELSAEYLTQVRELEQDLRAINVDGERLTKVLSLADAEAIAARAPLSHLFAPSSRLSAMYLVIPVFFEALLTEADPDGGGRKLRIMLRSREQLGTEQKLAMIDAVETLVHERVTSDPWRQTLEASETTGSNDETSTGTVTGYYVLMSRLVSQLIGDQWRCFLASGVLVWILLAIATRSIRLATVSLIPNLLPIFLVLATVGLLGGKINMGAAMIAAVSIGLSIDGCVHFLAGYSRHRARKHDAKSAARQAAGDIGVPVMLATIALVVGFGALSTSEFIPTATFGTLVAATLALGTAVNLTLLPTIVAWAGR